MDSAPLKRKDLGLVGGLMVSVQALTSFLASQTVSNDIDALRKEIFEVRINQEQYFVRKPEMGVVSDKLDAMSAQLTDLKDQVSALKIVIQRDVSSVLECDPIIMECDKKVSHR